MSRNARQTLLAALAFALGIAILYLHPADEYFLGDSISTLLARSLTPAAAFRDLFRLTGSHWFRPIANGIIQYPLWEMCGLNFAPYHYLAMTLHGLVCLELFLALRRYLDDSFAAWAGAAFFAFHPIQFYATYDQCFYQEPIGTGATLGAGACLYGYATSGSRRALALGLVSFTLALWTREVAVLTPALLLIVLWPAVFRKRAVVALGLTGAGAAGFAYFYLFVAHPLRYQPAGYTADWRAANLAANFWLELRWAFGIAAGPETAGWRSPAAVTVLLWTLLAVALLAAAALPRSKAWRGAAWFCVASLPALSTHRLEPHHLYLALAGVAIWLAALLAEWRKPARLYAATAVLAAIFTTSAIGARFDAANSWAGSSSWETRLPSLYAKSALRGLPQWRGVWIVAKDGNAGYSWIDGHIFELMTTAPLETRLMAAAPPSVPPGIHVFEYRQGVLWPLAIPTSQVTAPAPVSVAVSIEPRVVKPGTSYRVRIPQLAGQLIDLRYSYNEHLPSVAYGFTRLNDSGTADIFTPRDIPWGRIDVVGVRAAGTIDWAPASIRIDVLRD